MRSFRPDETFEGPCEHCHCCPEFCCWCDQLKPEADPEDPRFDAGGACDAAYDSWRDDQAMSGMDRAEQQTTEEEEDDG